MSNTSLTERLSRLGPVTEPGRASSGPPEELHLTAVEGLDALTASTVHRP